MSLESIAKKLEDHPLTNELVKRSIRNERLILSHKGFRQPPEELDQYINIKH